MSVSTPSTACWSWDARTTSAPLDPGRGRGECARDPDPCNKVVRGRALLSDGEQTLSRALRATRLSPLVQGPGLFEVRLDAKDPPAGQHLRFVGFGQRKPSLSRPIRHACRT